MINVTYDGIFHCIRIHTYDIRYRLHACTIDERHGRGGGGGKEKKKKRKIYRKHAVAMLDTGSCQEKLKCETPNEPAPFEVTTF